MIDIRCENCGRLLAKEDNGVIDIKTQIKQKILIANGVITFFCPWIYFDHSGKKMCGKQTKVDIGTQIKVMTDLFSRDKNLTLTTQKPIEGLQCLINTNTI